MKSICRGLVITLGSTSTQYYTTIRGGEPHVPGADLLNTSFRSGGALPTSSGGPTPPQQLLSLAVWSKEKKQKIMRIGRRGKDCCCKFELIDGIQRLLCTGRGVIGPGAASSISVERGRESDGPPPTPTQGLTDVGSLALESLLKSSASLSLSASSSYQPGSSTNSMLRVSVDGVEWVGLRFFQITSTWRTHIKSFPLCSLSVGRADPSHANDSFPISVDPTTFSSH
ncbi:unnamed protein product [Dicrocoelium dendriticum]|nr:unnamed protein product [Dicrocoelium dendriticum]